MSDGTPIPINPSQEVTQNYRPGAAPSLPANNPWKLLALFLSMVIAGGTIISVMGKAFYVTRAEYTERVQKDAIEQTTLKQTLDNVRIALDNQKTEFKDQKTEFKALSDSVYVLKYELAKEGSRNQR